MGVGLFRVVFGTSLDNTNYVVSFAAFVYADNLRVASKATNFVDIACFNGSGSLTDITGAVGVTIFGGRS